MSDAIGDYIASLAEEAQIMRTRHGGVRRWWLNHDRSRCEMCLLPLKLTHVKISPYRSFKRRKRTA